MQSAVSLFSATLWLLLASGLTMPVQDHSCTEGESKHMTKYSASCKDDNGNCFTNISGTHTVVEEGSDSLSDFLMRYMNGVNCLMHTCQIPHHGNCKISLATDLCHQKPDSDYNPTTEEPTTTTEECTTDHAGHPPPYMPSPRYPKPDTTTESN